MHFLRVEMFRCVQLVFVIYILGYGLSGPTPAPALAPAPTASASTSTRNYGVDPIFGPLQPSEQIKEFVASVFRRQDDDDDQEKEESTLSTHDSGEALRPTDMNIHAHVGFDQYWPGGEWVYRKADIDRCNSSDTACSDLYKSYGPVCAGNHDLTAHGSFDDMCKLQDSNCRDGTATLYTTHDGVNNSLINFYEVGENGVVDIRFASWTFGYVALLRTKDVYNTHPMFLYQIGALGYYGYRSCLALYRSNYDSDVMVRVDYHYYEIAYGQSITDGSVHRYTLIWNSTRGYTTLRWRHPDGRLGRGIEYEDSYWRSFPVRYLAVWGGWQSNPVWWELTGWLIAYRGKCRRDLPTLPTYVPPTLRHKLEIEQYNFAERMDEFGFNYSRVGTSWPHYYYDLPPNGPIIYD